MAAGGAFDWTSHILRSGEGGGEGDFLGTRFRVDLRNAASMGVYPELSEVVAMWGNKLKKKGKKQTHVFVTSKGNQGTTLPKTRVPHRSMNETKETGCSSRLTSLRSDPRQDVKCGWELSFG